MMHAMGPVQLIVIAAVVLVLFGRGKVSSLMGEVGKGISAFKKGVSDGQSDLEKEAAATAAAAAAAETPVVAVARDVTPVEQKDQA
ncbi:MAG: twin-arginine translocase TatA/TatE family subunit [Paracoccaceae bacterium]